ncbi:MAG: hypothetical protein ACRC3H_04835 [Lachnospiraceae bacterium]
MSYDCRETNYDIKEILKKYKGQPIQVITESGMKYCGILVSAEDGGIDLVDAKSRIVHIEIRKIEAIVEPKMKLKRLCEEDDCCCEEEEDGKCCDD